MSFAEFEASATKKSQNVLIGSFSNGQIKEKSLDNVQTAYFSCTGKDIRRKRRRILVSETDRLSYVGKNFGPSASHIQQMCKYYVGIHDKDTGKIRICDTEVFNMLPHVPGHDVADQADQVDNFNEVVPDVTRSQKIDMLTNAFGSSKKQRAMESRLKLKVKGEALEQALSSAVDEALTQDLSQYTQKSDDSGQNTETIPPCNKEAQKPEDVYSLNDIISSVEMDAITNQAKELFDCNSEVIQEWNTSEKFPKYILKHLPYLPVSEDARWKKVKCLKYYHYMVQLYHYRAVDLKRKYPFPQEWPDCIKNQLLSRFTLKVQSGKQQISCMPARLKDKLVCYILVLCLIMEEYHLEVSDLLIDLKMGFKRLQTHLRMLGCQIKTQKLPVAVDLGTGKVEIKTAVLSIPLTFPKPATPRKKQDRR